MLLRVVTVTIAEGQEAPYWAWSREVLALWDARGVVRAGGPYAATGASGESLGVWLTVHPGEDEMRDEFTRLYADDPGRALMQRRPPLVASTLMTVYAEWDPDRGDPKGLPVLVP
ncbi:MAG: hypothetical protein ACKVVT_17820 [Dehalococcoidia bacterium]